MTNQIMRDEAHRKPDPVARGTGQHHLLAGHRIFPTNSRTWYVPPRCPMPVNSFGVCFLRAIRVSVSSRIGQSVYKDRSWIIKDNRYAVHGGHQGEVEPPTKPRPRPWPASNTTTITILTRDPAERRQTHADETKDEPMLATAPRWAWHLGRHMEQRWRPSGL
jgi:hypothetical protein